MLTSISADIMEKLKILSDAAKFDVACTSSGASRSGNGNDMGSAFASGICHSFTADGRCISLLKNLRGGSRYTLDVYIPIEMIFVSQKKKRGI